MRSHSLTAALIVLLSVAVRPAAAQAAWCPSSAVRSAQAPDSARIADLALRTLVQRPDTLVCYWVQQFRRDSAGVVVTVLPELLPRFSQLDMVGGGGVVRVNGDSAVVLVWYR